MKRGSLIFLRFSIIVIGLFLLIRCVFWLPSMASQATEANPTYAYLALPLLIGIYITAIPFYIALYQAYRLLNFIQEETAFSKVAVEALECIKKSALTIISMYTIGVLILLQQNALHPGLALIAAAIIFVTVVITLFAAVLQETLERALHIKAENDLTV
ncbi:DUF2975 domain-containing protein [Rummeliibacillus sp. TYF-LIM-RU47]|uniref:DUF2975 domain-containing protein n=1 Tax=Rummeliibacillus sp. TYF-LIM-RU47 TaxID=2608406 RepID=UPI00123B8B64|nr:DUF2975 domain-containing protein [Rummeliibacillus sp. TYF-LIM-RU47]